MAGSFRAMVVFLNTTLIGPKRAFSIAPTTVNMETAQSELSTAAVSFGVSEGDQIGAAFTLDIRFLGVPVGSGVIYAWGTKTETRIDGTLGRLLDLKPLPDLFFPSGGDQFSIFATP